MGSLFFLSLSLKRLLLIIAGVTLITVSIFVIWRGSARKDGATPTDDYVQTLEAIARDIESLKNEFPQLKEFSIAENLHREQLTISYHYHTHAPTQRVGWTGGVPNPDDDGVWFYLDFHDPDSQTQIHTQPIMIPAGIGQKRVSFLILEGNKTKSIEGRIWSILRKHGVREY